MWVWVVGAIVALLLVCGCGGAGLYFVTQDDDSSASSTSEEEDSDPTDEDSEPTDDETDPTEDETEPTSTTTEPIDEDTSTTPAPTGSQSVPPTPAGSTKNTDDRFKATTDELEREVAKRLGHSASEITCPNELVYIEGRSTTCQAPARSGSGESSVYVTVAWAAKTSDSYVRSWLTYRQYR